MNTVFLHGELQKFGGPYRLDISSPVEAVRALGTQLPGFYQELEAGEYRVLRGQLELGEESLGIGLSDGVEVHIVPVIAGAKSGGVGKAILGTAIVAAAIALAPATAGGSLAGLGATAFSVGGYGVTYGAIALFGTALALQGVSQMLSPTPATDNYNDREKDDKNSFVFNGAANVVEQGQPIPLVYGRFRVGSIVASSGLSAEDI